MIHLLDNWFGWPNGSVLTNLLASVLWVVPTYTLTLWHYRCRDCWRPGHVPVKGTRHKVCKKHAAEHGHVH